MTIINPFFEKKNSIKLNDIKKALNINHTNNKHITIKGISDLKNAKKNEISFLNSLKYFDLLKKTNAKYVLVEMKNEKLVKQYTNPLIVNNVLKSVGIVTNLFYPSALDDMIDMSVKKPNLNAYNHIKFGKNVLLGKNVKIGKNTIVGHNTIIESKVKIGSNCEIGNYVKGEF